MVAPFVARHDVTSWGRVTRNVQRVAAPTFASDVRELLLSRGQSSVLVVGNRRSYGDSVLNSSGVLIAMDGADHFISFDTDRGVVRAEAGVTLDAILRLIVPFGWFLPTTPGTMYVTLGGAVANDVHGKNHHSAGTFGCHVTAAELVRSNGERVVVGPRQEHDLFAATVGGLGLTGAIEWVEVALTPITSSSLDVEVTPFESLSEFWTLAEAADGRFEHTVAWIDCTARDACLGRGVFSAANWQRDGALKAHETGSKLAVPIDAPRHLLNQLTVKAFNRLYHRAQSRKAGRSIQNYCSFFYPLDSIAGWNRLYGKPGFYQYQCALPVATMRDATTELLQEIARSGQGSFLAVLKTFGPKLSPGLLSFPREGSTLALDFPNRGAATLQLLERLDRIVMQATGRLYAAKDGRISKQMWIDGYRDLDRFSQFVDPAFSSDFWQRVA